MDQALQLHTFARRTCMTRFDHWAETYDTLVANNGILIGSDYTDEAYGIFPRYNVDKAVLDSVEAIDADALPNLEELRARLIHAARTASSDFTQPMENAIGQRAMADERAALATLFGTVTASELGDVSPLFYRRTLAAAEVRHWRKLILTAWGAPEGYWYPIGDNTHHSLVALELNGVDEACLQERIRRFWAENGVGRVVELSELGNSFEVEASAAQLEYASECLRSANNVSKGRCMPLVIAVSLFLPLAALGGAMLWGGTQLTKYLVNSNLDARDGGAGRLKAHHIQVLNFSELTKECGIYVNRTRSRRLICSIYAFSIMGVLLIMVSTFAIISSLNLPK